MWYRVDIVLAKKPDKPEPTTVCEECSVLFEASCALDAYQKGVAWGEDYSHDTDFHLLGIRHILDIGEERPGDGTEVGGGFFEEADPWGRKDELIPSPSEVGAVRLEASRDVPIGQLMSDEQHRMWRRISDEE